MEMNQRLAGMAIAAAAAALFVTGCSSTGTTTAPVRQFRCGKGEVLRGQRMQGPGRVQDGDERLQGSELVQRARLRLADRAGLRRAVGPRLIESFSGRRGAFVSVLRCRPFLPPSTCL